MSTENKEKRTVEENLEQIEAALNSWHYSSHPHPEIAWQSLAALREQIIMLEAVQRSQHQLQASCNRYQEQIATLTAERDLSIAAAQKANGLVEPLLDQIATLEAAAKEREGRVAQIMIGGNHLASALIGWLGAGEKTFPPYLTSLEDARKAITSVDHYDAWVCWKSIMEARDAIALSPASTPSTEPADDAAQKEPTC